MNGLPEVPSTRRRRAVWDLVILGGVERLTEHLMSGRAIPEADLDDMRALRRRLKAFEHALDVREASAGLIDNEDSD